MTDGCLLGKAKQIRHASRKRSSVFTLSHTFMRGVPQLIVAIILLMLSLPDAARPMSHIVGGGRSGSPCRVTEVVA